jgi:DNA-binding MarR family transcriptional regulator
MMVAPNQLSEKEILRLLSTNYDCLMDLFPDLEKSLGDISESTNINPGNLSRAVIQLEEHGLIYSRSSEAGANKPRKMLRLTPMSQKLIKSIKEGFLSEEEIIKEVDAKLVDEYVDLLRSDREEVRTFATDHLQRESSISRFPLESSFHKYLKKHFLDEEHSPVIDKLLLTLENLVANDDPLSRERLSQLYKDDLFTMSQATNRAARSRFIAVKTLSSMMNEEQAYDFLRTTYLKFIDEGLEYTDKVRDLLIERVPERRDDLKLVLLKHLRESSKSLSKIDIELNSLTK